LPEALAWAGEADHPVDLTFVPGRVPEALDDPIQQGPLVGLSRDGAYHLRIPGLARFLVPPEGRSVIVDAEVSPDTADLRLFLLTSCLDAVMERRGYLVLTGAVVVVKGRTVALLGKVGLGRSPLVAALLERGHAFLSAETCILTLSGDPPRAVPSHPDLLLHEKAAGVLGWGGVRQTAVRKGVPRLHCPASHRFLDAPRPVDAMVVTATSDGVDAPGLQALRGTEGMSRLLDAGHGHGLARLPAQGRRFMELATRFVADRRASILHIGGGTEGLRQAACDLEEARA
jgi:hypothetical protein